MTRRLATGLLLAGPLLAAVGLAALEPSDDAGSAVCPWRRCTGGACPGCGLTRSLAHLVRLDWAAAWQLHPLGWLVAIELVVAWALFVAARAGRFRLRTLGWVNAVLAANVVLLVGVWAVRLTAGTLPPV